MKLYFVHPDTKGRVRMSVPVHKANAIRALFREQGYCEVSGEEYRRFTRKWSLSELDKEEDEE